MEVTEVEETEITWLTGEHECVQGPPCLKTHLAVWDGKASPELCEHDSCLAAEFSACPACEADETLPHPAWCAMHQRWVAVLEEWGATGFAGGMIWFTALDCGCTIADGSDDVAAAR